jgi:hypothetical protein
MHRYRKTAEAITEPRPAMPRPARKPTKEATRQHAANWLIGVGILTLAAGVAIWTAAKAAGAPVNLESLALAPLVAILAGGVAFAVKLLQFTEEHRSWLYALELAAGQDLDADGIIGEPAQEPAQAADGSFVKGIDGAWHRVDVELEAHELHAIKKHLLTAGKFTVRAVNDLLGDDSRASALRVELYRLGILEEPEDRKATKLTDAGRKAVRRWA